MNPKAEVRKATPATPRRTRRAAAPPPRSIPTVLPEPPEVDEVEQPFVEGAHDAIDPDLRHRMISETAFGMYARRGFVDGFDVEDWLAAEAEVDHVLTGRPKGLTA